MNMSFCKTVEQARAMTKDVTRRERWKKLKVGDIVQQIVKGQGLKKGEKIEKIHRIYIVRTEWEPLRDIILRPYRKPYIKSEMEREGFPDMTATEFVEMYCELNERDASAPVNRIEFVYWTGE